MIAIHHIRQLIEGSTQATLAVMILLALDLEPASADEQVLPDPLSHSSYDDLLNHSPFTRSLDRSESLQLTGFAEIDGKPVVTLFDREKKKRLVVSDTPNSEGWRMVEVEPNLDPAQVAATLSVDGGELVTIHYDEGQLASSESASGKKVIKIPTGVDYRPLPTDKERKDFGVWVQKRMANFSEEQKKRVGQLFGEKMKANPRLSDRQKGQVFVQILDVVESGK
ncbi:MAG: hypothetical protein AAGA96_03830 [Verrucomicrobiota bacterium]